MAVSVTGAARPTGRISDVFNLLKRHGTPSPAIQQMNQIVAKAWAGKR